MNKSEKFWDKRSTKYDRRFKKYEQTYIETIENTKRYLASSDIVLDFACGTGIITNELAGNVREIHAIDISSKMIEIAERKANKRNIENINFTQSSIFDEKFKQEFFNVILAFSILHLIEDGQKVMKRINDLLKSGGLFISITPIPTGKEKTFLSIFLPLLMKIGMAPFIKLFRISELEDLVAKSNFEIVDKEKLCHISLHYFLVAKKI